MHLDKFDNGIERQVSRVKANIDVQGIHIQHEGEYSYSVGMNEVSLPEVIVYKGNVVSDKEVEQIFLSVHQSVSIKTMSGKLNNLTIECKMLNEMDKRHRFYSARLYYGHWDFSAMLLEVRSGQRKCD